MTDRKPLELSAAKQHDILQAPMPGGRLGSQYVMSRCGHLHVAYYDEVAKRSYPTLAQLIERVKQGGRFHIAIQCQKHRWFEQPSPELIQQLQEIGERTSV